VLYSAKVAKDSGKKYKAAIMIGNLGDPNAIQRRDGFGEAVAPVPDAIEVVARCRRSGTPTRRSRASPTPSRPIRTSSSCFTSSDFLLPQITQ
jgi:hypothetical protein